MGAETCQRCHAEIYERWNETAHARAFESLALQDKWDDPACAVCHTTGFGVADGMNAEETNPQFWNVQCEACHGMGTDHPGPEEGGRALRPVTESVCVTCHDEANSPDFDLATYLEDGVH